MCDGKLLFVYGTLKTGGRLNQHMLDIGAIRLKSKYVLEYSRLVDTGHGFPACTPYIGPNSDVVGELWAVPHKGFERLDYVEGVPTLFERVNIEFTLDDSMLYGYVYQSTNWDHINSPELINEEGYYEWPVK